MKPKTQIKSTSPLIAALAGLALTTISCDAAITSLTVNSTVDNAYAGNVSTADLVNSGQPTLSSFTSSPAPQFGPGGPNDGTYHTASTASAAYYPSLTNTLPATLTFTLDLSVNTLGYDLTEIDTFAGWKGGSTQTYANQKYSVEYSVVGSAAWLPLISVDESPFTDTTSQTPANAWTKISDGGATIASGVNAIRFLYVAPTIDDPAGPVSGTVIQEIDVQGFASVPEPAMSALLALGMFGFCRRRRN